PKGLDRVARLPPAFVLQCLGQIPVIQSSERSDFQSYQFVDQPVVEVEALGVRLPSTLWEDARPGDREAIGVGANVFHKRHITSVAMVMIIGDIAGRSVPDVAGGMGISVPYRRPLAILLPRTLDLVGGGCRPPIEALGELPGSAGLLGGG